MIASNENVIRMFGKPSFDYETDCIVLYEDQDSFIHYIRDYVANVEYVIVSNVLAIELPASERPASSVYLLHHFHLLKHFSNRIERFLIESHQQEHFDALFNTLSIEEAFS